MKRSLRLLALLLAAALLLTLGACSLENAAELLPREEDAGSALPAPEETPAEDAVLPEESDPSPPAEEADLPDPDGTYASRDEVALYIHTYGTLSQNFIPKRRPRPWAGPAARWSPMPRGSASAGAGSAIMRAFSPTRRGGPGRNATSTPWVPTAGGPGASSFPTTG